MKSIKLGTIALYSTSIVVACIMEINQQEEKSILKDHVILANVYSRRNVYA